MQGRWRTPDVQRALAVAAILLLTFAFLGSRGLWDPDEGRYTNVAAHMLSSGDWLTPHRNNEVGHWTKPPLTYWAEASSLRVFGMNPWAARIPVALAYLACIGLVARIARRVVPGRELHAALVFATMLLPAIASQLVTTDFLLAACETLAMWAYVELRWGDGRMHWRLLMWLGFALAFLTKGPPGLLPLLAIALAERVLPPSRRAFHPIGFVVFAVVALWWFVVVIARTPGLLQHFLGMEVVDRFATNEFRRHGEWYGWLVVYGPTLLLGTLPWTPGFFGWLRALPAHLRALRTPEGRDHDGKHLLLAAWIVLPLAVFCIARSRLPLYVLPLFVPIALVIASQYAEAGGPMPWRRLLVWVPLLIGLRLYGSMVDSPQDARAMAEAIRARTPGPIDQVIFLDEPARYGLRLHLGAEVDEVSLAPIAAAKGPRIDPAFDEDAATELRDDLDSAHTVWVCEAAHWSRVEAFFRARGYSAQPLGAPWREQRVFRVVRKPGA